MNAPDKITEIKGAATAIAAIITGLIGWAGWAVMLFLALVIIDWTTGSCAAKKAGDWNSARSREGRWHKVGEIVAVVAAFMCDLALKIGMQGLGITLPIDYETLFGPLVTMWYRDRLNRRECAGIGRACARLADERNQKAQGQDR